MPKDKSPGRVWVRQNPRCVFCDVETESSVVYEGDDSLIQGWRCPQCGFTLINPDEIQKAIDIIKKTAEVWRK